MSGIGERDDAPEVETVEDTEIEDAVEQTEAEDEGAEEDEQPEDAGEDHEGGGESEPAAVAAKPRSAATIAVQEAKRKAKDAEARAEAAERRASEYERAQQGQRTESEQRLEAERVSLMSPDERVAYEVAKVRREQDVRFGALEFRMQDGADRTGFDALCARNPAFDAVRDEVESGLAKMRNGGGNTTRENLAVYLIGKRAVERAAKGGKTKQASKGADRIQRQTVKAPAARGDVAGGEGRRGGSEASARRSRIENLEI